MLQEDGLMWSKGGPAIFQGADIEIGHANAETNMSFLHFMLTAHKRQKQCYTTNRRTKYCPQDSEESSPIFCGMLSSMKPRSPSSWKLLPCNELQNATFICEFGQSDKRYSDPYQSSEHFPFESMLINAGRCQNGSLFYRSSCWFPFIHDLSSDFDCHMKGYSPHTTYTDYDKTIYLYTYMATRSGCFTQKHLNLFLFSHGKSILNWDHKFAGTLLHGNLPDLNHNNKGYPCKHTLLYCIKEPEMNLTEQNHPYVVACESGEYIWRDNLCDGMPDCYNQTDESNCPWLCRSKFNNLALKDCTSCHEESCLCNSLFFQCHAGGCVDVGKVCDKERHCLDGSDESMCFFKDCSNKEFECDTGLCIPSEERCDGLAHCPDGSDETGCSKYEICPEFICATGECISRTLINDLIPDCPHGEDEEEYWKLVGVTHRVAALNLTCESGRLPCHPGHSRCFPINVACMILKQEELYLFVQMVVI